MSAPTGATDSMLVAPPYKRMSKLVGNSAKKDT